MLHHLFSSLDFLPIHDHWSFSDKCHLLMIVFSPVWLMAYDYAIVGCPSGGSTIFILERFTVLCYYCQLFYVAIMLFS